MNKSILLDDFSGGMNTDLDELQLGPRVGSLVQNADTRNGKLASLGGRSAFLSGLPESFYVISPGQFLFTSPSEMECTLVYGKLGGEDKLYVKPYIAANGTWVAAWLDLTEKVELACEAETTTTTVKAADLIGTNNYYNGWIYYNQERNIAAIVTGYNGSTKVLTLSWAITGQDVGDAFLLVRNNIWMNDGTSYFSPDGACRFLARQNAIDILTGSDAIYDADASGKKSDLILVALNGHRAFDNSLLNFTGFYLTRKNCSVMHPGTGVSTFQTLSPVDVTPTGEIALTDGSYIVLPVATYDNYQDAPLFKGDSPFDQSAFGATYSGHATITLSGSNKKIEVSIILNYGIEGSLLVPLLTPNNDGQDVRDHLIFDRRITHIKIYAAAATVTATGVLRPSSDFRLIDVIEVDSANWTPAVGTPAHYVTVYITKDKYDANADVAIQDEQGHGALKIHTNAMFAASTRNRVAAANVYADEKRQSFVFFSPVNADAQNTPSIFPHSSFLDCGLYGIAKITGFVDAGGKFVASGENKIITIDAANLTVTENLQSRGNVSLQTFIQINGLVYFVDLSDVYFYHPSQNVVRGITAGYIREAWRTLSTADKESAAIGYDHRLGKLVIAAGSVVYLYNLPRAYASDLASDTQAIGTWEKYDSGTTFVSFFTALDGSCVGIDATGVAWKLFDSANTNMVYEKVIADATFSLDAVRMTYSSTSQVLVKLYDLSKNTAAPLRTYTFPSQSRLARRDIYKGGMFERLKVRIEASAGTIISSLHLNPSALDDNR